MSEQEQVSVLIVDDDQDNREVFRMALEEEGFAVSEAADGVQALALLRDSSQPLVVILDQLMPRLLGSDLLREVAQDGQELQRHAYLMVTASTQAKLLDRQLQSLALSSVPIITKPIDLDELISSVQEAAEHLPSTEGGTPSA